MRTALQGGSGRALQQRGPAQPRARAGRMRHRRIHGRRYPHPGSTTFIGESLHGLLLYALAGSKK